MNNGPKRTAWAEAAMLAGVLSTAGAQQQVMRIDRPPQGPFGNQLAAIGDRNGDGHADIAVAVYVPIIPTSSTLVPELWFFSGSTGQPLGQGRRNFIQLASAGDSDGDGVGDYVLSCSGPAVAPCYPYECAAVEVRSGVTDALLWQCNVYPFSEMGTMLVSDLDLDGDSRPDVLTATTYPSFPGMGGGSLFAISNGGKVLYELRSPAGEAFAPGIGKFTDYDGDGCDDFLLGIYVAPGGAVDIRSGKNGNLLRRLPGHPPVLWGHGATAAMIGDQDGDGIPDVISGDSGFGTPGVLQVLGSVTGNLIHRWQVTQPGLGGDNFGYPTVACLDIDRDGIEDVVASAENGPIASWGQYAFSGRDGTLMKRFTATAQAGIMGTVRAFPPQPGDLFRKYISIGFTGYVGGIYMFSGAPGGVIQTGAGAPGTLAEAPRIGVRKFEPSGFRITLTDAEQGAPAFLVLGFSQPPQPGINLQALGFPGCTLFPSPDIYGLKLVGTAGIAAGYAMHDFTQQLRATPGVGTYAVYAQWVALGQTWPGGVSEAIRLIVQ
ncbi:MAG: VCBS repeat-containing protein [Planctomycetes bacterium]|jgi:hypothetical protein|nr:VCBS repeat-containing protein [Planctomycetota bacterium]